MPCQPECPSTPQPCGPCLGFPPGPQALKSNGPSGHPASAPPGCPFSLTPRFLTSASCSQLHTFNLVLCHWPCPSQPLTRPAHCSWPHSRGRADNQEAQTIVDCVFSFFFFLTLSGAFYLSLRARCEFDPWVRKIPWRMKLQPIPVFMSGKSHGQRSLVGYSPWGHKESDTTEQITL